jgi:hypothetical protein
LGLIALLAFLAAPQGAYAGRASGQAHIQPSPVRASHHLDPAYGALPLAFEPNLGQTDPRVKFLCRGIGYTLFICPDEMVLVLTGPAPGPGTRGIHGPAPDANHPGSAAPAIVRMRLVGGNPSATADGQDPLPGLSNYFIGQDPRAWLRNIPHYATAMISEPYTGMRLDYHGGGGRVEYDFHVGAGADPQSLAWDIQGADSLSLDQDGNLVVGIGGRSLSFLSPRCYQDTAGGRTEVSGGYVLTGSRLAFRIGAYDRTRELVVDPVLAYSTYLGGTGGDSGSGIGVDAAGDAYVTGSTFSANFPTLNPIQATLTGFMNVFVTKFTPAGNALIYSTYLGGNATDQATGIAVDPAGDAYVTGYTNSTNFPVLNPIQPGLAGGNDAFVLKLDPSGSALLYSTYLGGSQFDGAQAIALDGAGDAYIAGSTGSADFPLKNALKGTLTAVYNAFVSVLNPSGNALLYSTYLGGSGSTSSGDIAYGIAVDGGGNAYVTGSTFSRDFPLVNPYQAYLLGSFSVFVSKFNPDGSALLYSTYLGGSQREEGTAIAVNSVGIAYVTGYTNSPDFPLSHPMQPSCNGCGALQSSGFVTALFPSGSILAYSTFLGGSGGTMGYGIALDPVGDAYVTGRTESPNFPLADPYQSTLRGADNAFVSALDPLGGALLYSTYLGGSGSDWGEAIAVDAGGAAYITGITFSTNFPLADPYLGYLRGSSHAFVAKFGSDLPSPTPTVSPSPSATPTASPTGTASPVTTATRTATPTPSCSPSATHSLTLTQTPGSCTFNFLGAFPNPVPASGCVFGVSVGEAAQVDLRIYALSGQQVRDISVPLDAGSHEVAWDGRNDYGKTAAFGSYYVAASAQTPCGVFKQGSWISVLR